MGLSHGGLLLLLFSSAYSYQFRSGAESIAFSQDPELEWSRMEEILSEKVAPAPAPRAELYKSHSSGGSSVPAAKTFAEYVYVLSADYPKDVFKPEKGVRPLPNWAREMLLGPTVVPPAAVKAATPGKLVELLCHVDRMYVRVKRTVFKNSEAFRDLKLGTCPVNAGTQEHYYLLYLLKSDCGFKRESTADFLLISNTLYYKPSGVVLREMPFEISLQCKYPRHFRSYKVGFYPKLQGGTVYKALQPKSSITLSAHDAAGNELTGDKTYTLGLPMYFEAKPSASTSHSGGERMYINRCFMTAYQDPYSTPKYTVIDNQGCMVDSKVTVQSKFLSGTSKMVQKFSVGALVFKDKVSPSSSIQQLYMHCEMSKGTVTPTSAAKACTFDPTTKKWKELYGDDSVCTCCDSTCPSAQPKASRNLITSSSWKVDLSGKNDYVDVNPQMKSLNADTFNLGDPDLAEHEDFLNYWDSDY